jgi:hypothetical protein
MDQAKLGPMWNNGMDHCLENLEMDLKIAEF